MSVDILHIKNMIKVRMSGSNEIRIEQYNGKRTKMYSLNAAINIINMKFFQNALLSAIQMASTRKMCPNSVCDFNIYIFVYIYFMQETEKKEKKSKI